MNPSICFLLILTVLMAGFAAAAQDFQGKDAIIITKLELVPNNITSPIGDENREISLRITVKNLTPLELKSKPDEDLTPRLDFYLLKEDSSGELQQLLKTENYISAPLKPFSSYTTVYTLIFVTADALQEDRVYAVKVFAKTDSSLRESELENNEATARFYVKKAPEGEGSEEPRQFVPLIALVITLLAAVLAVLVVDRGQWSFRKGGLGG